jgi:hypothetical protein
LNIIENLWKLIKERVYKKKPTNADELIKYITEEWYNIDINIIWNLYDSIFIRLLKVIHNKGEVIDY